LQAEDGRAGTIKDVLFDDGRWTVRHFVVESGGLLSKHKVILDPMEAMEPDVDEKVLPVRLTKDEIKRHPIPESDPALTSKFKGAGPSAMRSAGAGSMIGANPAEVMLSGNTAVYESGFLEPDPHLRSASDVLSFKLRTGSEDIGTVMDFVIDPVNWSVPYAVVELDDQHRQVLLPTDQISKIGFPDKVLTTEMMPETLREAEPFEGF
jgi:uncharacterized protein YrrD